MKCLKCGKTYDDKLKFCPVCGEKNKILEDHAVNSNYNITLNRVLDIICRKTTLSFICIVASGLLVITYIQMVLFQSYAETEKFTDFSAFVAISNRISNVPMFIDLSKYLCIFVFVVSVVNAIRKKEAAYSLISSLSAMSIFALMINSETINALKMLLKMDESSIYKLLDSYDDAKAVYKLLMNPKKLAQGVQGEVVFGVFIFIASILLFILFLKQLLKHNNEISCVNCGRVLETDMKFCPSCGETVVIENPKNYCKKCGKEFEKDMNFCPYCGEKADRVEKKES